MPFFKNIFALLFGLLLSVIILLSFELLARQDWFPKQDNVRRIIDETSEYQPLVDVILQKKSEEVLKLYNTEVLKLASEGVTHLFKDKDLAPNSSFNQKIFSKKTKTVILENKFALDEHMRRNIPINKNVSKNIYFLGGSFTFGSFVKDDENFPYIFSKLRRDLNVYNMGIGGGAPNMMLQDLQEEGNIRWEHLEKTKSSAVYTFIDDHLNRVVCRVECFASKWMLELPFYAQDGNEFKTTGDNLKNLNLFEFYILKILSMSHLARKMNLNYPLRLNDSHFHYFVSLIDESRKILKSKFGVDDFYVLLFPGISDHHGGRLLPTLKLKGYQIIDLRNIRFPETLLEQLKIPGDGHPSPLMHEIIAKLLSFIIK